MMLSQCDLQTGMSNGKEEVNDGRETQVVNPDSHHLTQHREA